MTAKTIFNDLQKLIEQRNGEGIKTKKIAEKSGITSITILNGRNMLLSTLIRILYAIDAKIVLTAHQNDLLEDAFKEANEEHQNSTSLKKNADIIITTINVFAKKKGIKQTDIAVWLGVEDVKISNWFRHKYYPYLNGFVDLCNVLGITATIVSTREPVNFEIELDKTQTNFKQNFRKYRMNLHKILAKGCKVRVTVEQP